MYYKNGRKSKLKMKINNHIISYIKACIDIKKQKSKILDIYSYKLNLII